MQMTEYQIQAASTAAYPHAGSGDALALAYLGLGLGEAGEVQGKIKKILRDSDGIVSDEIRLAVAKELGDVLWYVALMAQELQMDLTTVARMNLAKLASRAERGVIGGSGDER